MPLWPENSIQVIELVKKCEDQSVGGLEVISPGEDILSLEENLKIHSKEQKSITSMLRRSPSRKG